MQCDCSKTGSLKWREGSCEGSGEARDLFWGVWELLDGLLDDLEGFLDLLLGDDEWRSESDDVLVSWFGLGDVS